MEPRYFTQEEVFGGGADSPEANLWQAVLTLLIRDIEETISDSQRDLSKKGYVSIYNHNELQHLLRLAASPWVGEICLFIDLAHSQFLRGCNNLVAKAGLESYPFERKDLGFVFKGKDALRKRGL